MQSENSDEGELWIDKTPEQRKPNNSWIVSKFLDINLKDNKLKRRKRKSNVSNRGSNKKSHMSFCHDENIEPVSSPESQKSKTTRNFELSAPHFENSPILFEESDTDSTQKSELQRELFLSSLKKTYIRTLFENSLKTASAKKKYRKSYLKTRHIEQNVEIESVDSQDSKQDIDLSKTIENTSSPVKENYDIETVSSQDSSQITISSCSSGNPNSADKDSESSLDICSPTHKRRYKKGTLAFTFQRIIRKYKANFSIWKHELYLAETSAYKIPATDSDHLITTLKIINIENNFGITVLKCKLAGSDDSELCLIIVNTNVYDELLEVNDVIKIFPPFFVKSFVVNNESMKTYVNVSKIAKLKNGTT